MNDLSGRGGGLHKVVLHETLEVEVGKLIGRRNLKELGKLGIGIDLAAVALVLKTICRNVGVNLLAHVRARHLSADGLAEERGELLADERGLDEARGLAGARGLALLGGSLLGGLQLAGNRLLEHLEIVLDGREKAGELLELGVELGNATSNARGLGCDGGIRGDGGNNGSRGRGGDLNLRLLYARLGLDNGGSNNGGGGGRSLRGPNHSGYILLTKYAFKLFFR